MSYRRPAMPLPRSSDKNLRAEMDGLSIKPTPPQIPPRKYTHTITDSLDVSQNGEEAIMSIQTAANIFSSALSLSPPLNLFSCVTHPVEIPANVNTRNAAVSTNKFYGNLLLGSQTNPAWTHPYSFFWSKDSYLGLAVSYVRERDRVFGPGSPPQYFFGPVGIKSFVFGSADFADQTQMSLGFENIKHMSIEVKLFKSRDQFISFPLVQGMGFATAVYCNLIPTLFSAVGFKSVVAQTSPRWGLQKYIIILENDVTWTLYVTVPSGQSLSLSLANPNQLVGDRRVNGCVYQLVADTNPAIDAAAGCYPTDCALSGLVSGSLGKYQFVYNVRGSSNTGRTLMYALPHHVADFTPSMNCRRINSFLTSVTCGKMVGYLTNIFDLQVEVPKNVGFEPFTTIPGKSTPKYSAAVLESIETAATEEVDADVVNESNLDSMYFAGKVLAKYAWILYCCQYVIKKPHLVQVLMPKLKAAISRFTSNQQILPLHYDTTWRGIISSGDSSQDFGNSYYNDHHFHYGYHVIAAAIVALVDRDSGDSSWLKANRTWVENLIRDYSNPNEDDSRFPVFRSFDWFAGHSWAKGLFESGDGKDQESSSEDVNAALALKLWGIVTNDVRLQGIGNLELGIMKTSLNSYFLYSDDNSVMPPAFIPNKVSGILFENKIDHTTYFGSLPQYIQMIHAIPVTPASSFIRSPTFVEQEWKEMLAPIIDEIEDGWKGIMMLNVSLFDPGASYEFFSSPKFSSKYLDGGQSKTWSLAYSGAFI
ncbi:LAMI_0H17502g1_1 [Lachancea mirantina]|uniref:glucan endo-1,3-beta-D-glucosidase n=1 Tax=Lachancea mirantina TaxID=1230905 RepID=A0A1G4KJE0_9SACH|nr:LAMI_0H17502g1_1 [Lachancea mirantina]